MDKVPASPSSCPGALNELNPFLEYFNILFLSFLFQGADFLCLGSSLISYQLGQG